MESSLEETGRKICSATVERMKVMALKHFSAETLSTLRGDFSTHVNFLADEMVFRFQMYVWKEDIHEEEFAVHVEVPATWWEHLKRDHFPEWLKSRFPVRCATITKTVKQKTFEAYPKLKAPLPNESSVRHTIFSEVP